MLEGLKVRQKKDDKMSDDILIANTRKNIALRKWRIDDIGILASIANNYEIAKNMTDGFPYPYSIINAKDFITSSQNNKNALLCAIQYNKDLVGSIGVFFQQDIYRLNASIAYFIDHKYWGKGIGSEAIRLITNYVFKQYKIIRLYAEPFERNLQSRKALEKAGYILEAIIQSNVIKNNEILNSCLYSCLKDDFKKVDKGD